MSKVHLLIATMTLQFFFQGCQMFSITWAFFCRHSSDPFLGQTQKYINSLLQTIQMKLILLFDMLKGHLSILRIRGAPDYQKVLKLYFQSQFAISKIDGIFSKKKSFRISI